MLDEHAVILLDNVDLQKSLKETAMETDVNLFGNMPHFSQFNY